jgi:hypothetical protein
MMPNVHKPQATHISLPLPIVAGITVTGLLAASNVFAVLNRTLVPGISVDPPHNILMFFIMIWTVAGIAWFVTVVTEVWHRRYFRCMLAFLATASAAVGWWINAEYFASCLAGC